MSLTLGWCQGTHLCSGESLADCAQLSPGPYTLTMPGRHGNSPRLSMQVGLGVFACATNLTPSQAEMTRVSLYFCVLSRFFMLSEDSIIERSASSHFLFVLHCEADCFTFCTGATPIRERWGCRCWPRGLSLPFLGLPFCVRALQNPFPDE